MSDSNLVRSIFVHRFGTLPPAYITPRLHYWCSPQPTHYPAIDDRWGGARIEMYVGCYSYDLMINFRVKYRVRYQYHAQVSPMTFQIPEHFFTNLQQTYLPLFTYPARKASTHMGSNSFFTRLIIYFHYCLYFTTVFSYFP
jgi:hypothetical protein